MIRFDIISASIYDDNNKYKNVNIRGISSKVVETMNKIIDRYIDDLIRIGDFDIVNDESYIYGGVGCGDNSLLVYENDYGCKFILYNHYDGSDYAVYIEINEKFEQCQEYVDIIHEIIDINLFSEESIMILSTLDINKKCIVEDKNDSEDDI